nr:lipocalin family protein [Paracoccus sphaerophysae]
MTRQAWLDREWSSQPLAADQTGWDWFSLFLDDGRRVMAFRLRGDADYLSGTLVGADGQSTPLTGADIALTPLRPQAGVPVAWRVGLPRLGLDWTVSAEPGGVHDHAGALLGGAGAGRGDGPRPRLS